MIIPAVMFNYFDARLTYRTRTALVVAFVLLSRAGMTAEAVNARDYAALRKSISAISLEDARRNPAGNIGRVVEVRGTVSGISRNGSQISLILSPKTGSSVVVSASKTPTDNPGVDLACLVRVGEGSTCSLTDLRLLAYTYDVDLRRLEEAWSANARAADKPTSAQKPTYSHSTNNSKTRYISVGELVRTYRNAVKGFNRRLSESEADTIARSILAFSSRYQVDPRLVCAVILAESHFRINATSRCGAMGLGQLMPSTAAGLGVDNAYDPVSNIYGSVRYIRGMLDRMAGAKGWNNLTWGDLALALAAYNAGPGAVRKHGGIPPYRETRNYVKRVVSIYKQLCGVK
jgi:hypothetical protein